MDPAVLLVATERDKVINIRDVVAIGLGELTVVPNEASDAPAVSVHGLIELV